MYILGVLCAWVTTSSGDELYKNLYTELFVDVYVICVILALMPRRVRFWIRQLLYIILYATALADVYCHARC